MTDLAAKTRWGDLKYVGVCGVAPAWLLFVLQYTGRSRLVTKWLVAALMVEPLAVLAVLAIPATHDLVRFYPESAAGQELPVVGTGPVFWVHLIYANLLILLATALFVGTMLRLSRTYRRMAATLLAAALLPWAANLLHNLEIGWFRRLDLTPFAFIVTGGVLVWGLFRERLVNLSPLARAVVVDNMADGVFVLDAFGRITDVNPSGARLLDGSRPALVGRSLAELLPGPPQAGPTSVASEHETGRALSLGEDGDRRHFDVRQQPLADRNGDPAGELVVLRDITERVRIEARLRDVLTEQSRVAAALQASLVPGHLPTIPTSAVAGLYQPAGDGSEIGGDFYDIFPLEHDSWGIVLGDVSGKGAEAAAVTALARYTLRTLAHPCHSPSETLRDLNARMLAETPTERHCTLVYAIARPRNQGIDLTVCLAGHHPPLVLRRSGEIEPIGRLGTALGLFERPDLYDSHLTLGPGDLICLFTDGLVEARAGSSLFGSERVAAVMREYADNAPAEIAAKLSSAARHFHGNDLTDDLALLILRVDTAQDSAVDARPRVHGDRPREDRF